MRKKDNILDTDLAATIAEVRAPRKVVFVNGCFDLLHIGHIRMLESAAKHGDFLVVGINNDESVRKNKGEGRPLVPAKDRAEKILASGDVTMDKERAKESLIRAETRIKIAQTAGKTH